MVATAPLIVSRSAWGANPLVTPASTIPTPTDELWLHHTAGEQFDEAGMRMLQSFTLHRPDAHYVDLEYTFVIDHVDCRIFESRGPGHDSAATFDHNAISHAICVMGNFQTDPVSDPLIHTLANLVAWGYEHGWWKHCAITGGHRDASNNSTACPGDHLEQKIGQINALALQIHAGPTPVPAPKVRPMYDPPLVIPGGIAAECVCPTGGYWQINPVGQVYAFGGAPWHGNVFGQPWWGGRQVARIRAIRYGFLNRKAAYQITATSGETYVPKENW